MKRYFWLGYLLLLTAVAALSAGLVNAYFSARLSAPLPSAQTQARSAAGPLTQKEPLAHYEVINKRNIFNAKPPVNTPEPPRAPEPPPPPPEVPETPLQLKLIGTLADALATTKRFAILESTGNPPGQAVYQVGDVIQQAVLVEIRPGCVLLERNTRRQELCFQQDNSAAPAPPKPPPAPRAAAPPAPAAAPAGDAANSGIVRVDTGTWRVGRELILEHFANVGSLASQATITPYFAQGQQLGFRLSQMRAGGVLQQIGLQEGDVLQKVNGLSIHTPQEALQAYQQLQSEPTVRLNILRNNSPTTLTYELR